MSAPMTEDRFQELNKIVFSGIVSKIGVGTAAEMWLEIERLRAENERLTAAIGDIDNSGRNCFCSDWFHEDGNCKIGAAVRLINSAAYGGDA